MKKCLNITIVDDNVSITDIFKDYIDILGINAKLTVYNNPEKALTFIKDNNEIDILITDYKMPVINGVTLLEASSPDTVRVMISGFLSSIASNKLEKLGAIFYEKPVPMKKISELFNNIIEKK